MPVKISKKSKKTKGKGKVSQSQQVVVNIQKGKRRAASQPVVRHSQAPIIIQPPQQDYSVLENLFKQYSSSRSVAEPVKQPIMMGMETQTDNPLMVAKEQQTQLSVPNVQPLLQPLKETQKQLNERLSQLNLEKEVLDTERLKKAIDTTMVSERRRTSPPQIPLKVLNPKSGKMIKVGTRYYRTLVKEGIIKPE
jgi:hypothetical protein